MRILFLTPRLPYPPDRGDRLRAYHFIEHVAREHEVSLASFIASEAEREHVEPLRAFCREVRVVHQSSRQSALGVLSNAWRGEPLQALYYRSNEMGRLVEEMLGSSSEFRVPSSGLRAAGSRFDLVYVHLFRMAQYVERRRDCYRVVDLTDVISEEVRRSLPYRGLVWRAIYGVERPRIERYERWVADTFEETWLISEADRAVLAARCPRANIRVVRNGVDLDRFYPTGRSGAPNRLIFVGNLRVLHNVDAVTYLVQDVLPLVRERVPACELQIVGAGPGPAVLRLAEEPGVLVTGFVPDLNEYLNGAAVFIAPLRFAAGVQNKVLEAMAAGRPVVTTSLVNAGLGARAGEDLLVADDAPAIADRIVALLQDAELRRRVGESGQAFVRRTYTWRQVLERVREIGEAREMGSVRDLRPTGARNSELGTRNSEPDIRRPR